MQQQLQRRPSGLFTAMALPMAAVGALLALATAAAQSHTPVETKSPAKPASAQPATTDAATHETPAVEYSGDLLIQLAVSDLQRSMDFYGTVLGLKQAVYDPGLEWAKYDLPTPGVRLGIGRQDTVTGSGTISINIGVKNVDQARRALEARGVQFPGASINIPGVVKLADFTDPDGNRLRLAGPPDAEAPDSPG